MIDWVPRLRDDAICLGVLVVHRASRLRDDAICLRVLMVRWVPRLRDDAICLEVLGVRHNSAIWDGRQKPNEKKKEGGARTECGGLSDHVERFEFYLRVVV